MGWKERGGGGGVVREIVRGSEKGRGREGVGLDGGNQRVGARRKW